MNPEKVEVEKWECSNCGNIFPIDKKGLAEGCCVDFNNSNAKGDSE